MAQRRRMRLPNGFGRITKITNASLRKPYRAGITIKVLDDGKTIGKTLGYYHTYNEAYSALIEYHKNPYDLCTDRNMTVARVYALWTDQYFKTISDSSARCIKSAWTRCKNVKNMLVADIRARHIKGCIDEADSPNMKDRVKSMWNLMLDYALEYELVEKNYARTFELSKEVYVELEKARIPHMSFSDDEMRKIWSACGKIPYADLVIVQCYSGWRPKELGMLKISDIDMANWTFRGGIKTAAGKDRIVPIHSSIRKIVAWKYNEALSLHSEYLFNCTDARNGSNGLKLTYDKYSKRFKKIVNALELNPAHRAHDPRMQFITMAKKYEMNEYAIKRIVGHQISDITERVYTDRDLAWLCSEMEKIKGSDYSA